MILNERTRHVMRSVKRFEPGPCRSHIAVCSYGAAFSGETLHVADLLVQRNLRLRQSYQIGPGPCIWWLTLSAHSGHGAR